MNVNELHVPTEALFFPMESPFKNAWVQVCGRATPSVPVRIVSDEKLLRMGLLDSEDE